MTPNDDTSPEPVAASDIVADAKAWLADIKGGQRLQTHSGQCHKWHSTCLVGKLIREVEAQRACTSAGRDEIARLRDLVDGLGAALETAGYIYRNTDSGPNLVRP
jgi:hypothetical protein